VGGIIVPGAGEVVERFPSDLDDVLAVELSALARALFRTFHAALPFQHRPAVEIILREFGEDRLEVHLAVAERAEAAGALRPRLVAAVDALFGRRIELRVLHMEHADAWVIGVDEAEIIELLQHEVARVIEDVAAPVPADTLEEHLEGDAV